MGWEIKYNGINDLIDRRLALGGSSPEVREEADDGGLQAQAIRAFSGSVF